MNLSKTIKEQAISAETILLKKQIQQLQAEKEELLNVISNFHAVIKTQGCFGAEYDRAEYVVKQTIWKFKKHQDSTQEG